MKISKMLGILVGMALATSPLRAQPEEPVKPVEFSKEEMARYAEVYENPYVIHTRHIFEGYLHGFPKEADKAGYCFENEQETMRLEGGDGLGFAAYRDYIKHPFVVMEINPAIMGGMTLAILFPKHPDKLFSVWVYDIDEASNCYELRSFRQLPHTKEEVAKLVRLYKNLIFKKKYSI